MTPAGPGGWYLIVFIPYIGAIVLLVMLAMPSNPGYNHYGPPPGMSSAAQPAQYWGPGRPEALRRFAEDSQRAAAAGYYPMWQEWKFGPAGEFLEVIYDRVPPQQTWGQPGYLPQAPGPYAAGGALSQGPGPYPYGGTYQPGPTQATGAGNPGGSGPGVQPPQTSPPTVPPEPR